MSAGRLLPAVLLVVALVLAVVAAVRMTGSGGADEAPPPPQDTATATGTAQPGPSGQEDEPAAAEEAEPVRAPIRRLGVLVYYPGAGGRGLVGEAREIFETTAPGDRAKQILSDLISGPSSNRAVSAVPPGTRLRQIYVMSDGVAYVDFSTELQQGLGGGSASELLTVYAIVDSLALNVREIRRVGILINGQPVDTLNGHVDLRRPLPPDRSLIFGEVTRLAPFARATIG